MTILSHAAYAPTARLSDQLHIVAERLLAIPRTALVAVKRRIVAAQTADELSRLSDAQLDDIGVVRGRIPGLCRDMAVRTVF